MAVSRLSQLTCRATAAIEQSRRAELEARELAATLRAHQAELAAIRRRFGRRRARLPPR